MRSQAVNSAFCDVWTDVHAIQAEHKLIVAIIARAILDYINPGFGGKKRNNKGRKRAELFIFEDGFEEDEWSLYWMLQFISEDPDNLRQKIRLFCVNNQDKRNVKHAFCGFRVKHPRKHPLFFRVK